MDDGKRHETCLNDTKSRKQRNTGRHGERGEKRHNKDHRMEKVKVLLKDFVLELPTEDGSYSQLAIEMAMVRTRISWLTSKFF